MNRRLFNSLSLLAAAILTQQEAHAFTMDDLSNKEASQGLKAALEKGAIAAVSQLGKKDGFLANDKVRIPLPGYLESASKMLRMVGQGSRLDDLV
jgi:hypothetical protein